MIHNTIIEREEDKQFVIQLFESGMFGEIGTDKEKVEVLTELFTNVGWPDHEAEIRMCAKYFLKKIKEDTNLTDGAIMLQLGKEVSEEIKNRWI